MAYSVSDLATIKKILGGTVKYIIPRYQRKYVWNDKHWQDLFDDLLFVYNSRGGNPEADHFFSTFIFEKKGNQWGIDCFNVIDGQQRLSTSMVIISAICRLLIERRGETQHRLLSQYLSAVDANGPYIKITNENADLLGEIIEENYRYKEADQLSPMNIKRYHSVSNDEKNIYKCYLFFYGKISELVRAETAAQEIENLNVFADCLLNMQVVQIIVDKEQEGYDIFEILNARGTPLAQHELLKNYIFKFYKPIGDIDNAKRTWSEIDGCLTIDNRNYLPIYIDHYTIHKYEKPDKVNTVLRIIKKANAKNNTKELLQDIYDKSLYYSWMVDPYKILSNTLFDDKKITENLFSIFLYFSLKTQSQFRPLILSLLARVKLCLDRYEAERELFEAGESSSEKAAFRKKEYRDCEKEVNRAITYLLHFSMIELVIKKQQPKEFEGRIHDLAKNIENGVYPVTKVFEILSVNITYDMFVKGFSLLGYSNKNEMYQRKKTGFDIRQLLRMYELHLRGTDELTIDNMTIEHVMNDSAHDVQSCYIGNLLPLAESVQRDIGEETEFTKKLPYYRDSEFETVKQFVKNYGSLDSWEKEQIEKRTLEIAEVFYKEIFHLS